MKLHAALQDLEVEVNTTHMWVQRLSNAEAIMFRGQIRHLCMLLQQFEDKKLCKDAVRAKMAKLLIDIGARKSLAEKWSRRERRFHVDCQHG